MLDPQAEMQILRLSELSSLCLKSVMCKFWIYWVDVNTKFTILQLILYLHIPSKFKIYNMTAE